MEDHRCQEYSMKYIYSTGQMSKLSLTLCTFNITGLVAGLFLTTEHYRRVGEYRKGELNNIFGWLEIFVYSSKGSEVQKSKLANEYKCQKEL